MKRVNELLRKYELKPCGYTKCGKVTLIDTQSGKFVVKPKKKDEEVFNYLKNRHFDYFPRIISDLDDEYEITEFVSDISLPSEQKMMDLTTLVGLLHNKTTYFKEVDFDDYKTIYEDISNNIEYLNSYYGDIITSIESKVYMSPSEYLLARNISKLFGSLNFSKKELDTWYKLVKDKTKQRYVVLHNNLDLSHFISGDKAYLLNWDKAKQGIPIFDFYILYKRHGLDFDFSEILKHYEHSYPLQVDERKLLFILIALPDLIVLENSVYEQTKKISNLLDLLYKTEKLISPYYSEYNVHDPEPQQ